MGIDGKKFNFLIFEVKM